MRRILLTALLAASGCGGTTEHEPWQPPAEAIDLNATPYTIRVFAKQAVFDKLGPKEIDGLEIIARMREPEGYAPTVKLPSDRPLVIDQLRTGVQEETSGQDTETVVLAVYPSGFIDVQVSAYANHERVAIGCATQTVNPTHTPSARIVVDVSTKESCLPP